MDNRIYTIKCSRCHNEWSVRSNSTKLLEHKCQRLGVFGRIIVPLFVEKLKPERKKEKVK